MVPAPINPYNPRQPNSPPIVNGGGKFVAQTQHSQLDNATALAAAASNQTLAYRKFDSVAQKGGRKSRKRRKKRRI